MTDFLFALANINLVMGAAIMIVALLRRPVRAAFHATIGYGLWLLVPAMALASLLPPRALPFVPPAIAPVTAMTAKLFSRGTAVMPNIPALRNVPHDWSWPVLAVWLAGAVAMATYFLWLQRGFQRAERAGTAGPAVAGFIRSRIVVPADFAARFSAIERTAIIAHEQAHLTRQDARVNAVATLLRCLCWFNPLVQLGALWMRRDQELACDAAALRSVARLDYAHTLLKAQMPVAATPLGCAWPGSEHPLTERVAMLQRRAPEGMRRWGGILAVASLTLCGSFTAWAQQERVPSIDMNNWKTVFYMYDKPVFYVTVETNRMLPIFDDAIHFTGPVTIHFPYGTAQAASGRLVGPDVIQMLTKPDGEISTVVLNDVELRYRDQTLHGETLTYDPRTYLLSLDGREMPSGIPQTQERGANLRIEFQQNGTGIFVHYPLAAQQAATPAQKESALTSDEMKLAMARQQHVTVSPHEVDDRIAELKAKGAVAPNSNLRAYVIAQIAWEKTRH